MRVKNGHFPLSLNDFIVLGLPSLEIYVAQLQILDEVCNNDLRLLQLAQEKKKGCKTTITFLGITIRYYQPGTKTIRRKIP